MIDVVPVVDLLSSCAKYQHLWSLVSLMCYHFLVSSRYWFYVGDVSYGKVFILNGVLSNVTYVQQSSSLLYGCFISISILHAADTAIDLYFLKKKHSNCLSTILRWTSYVIIKEKYNFNLFPWKGLVLVYHLGVTFITLQNLRMNWSQLYKVPLGRVYLYSLIIFRRRTFI